MSPSGNIEIVDIDTNTYFVHDCLFVSPKRTRTHRGKVRRVISKQLKSCFGSFPLKITRRLF